MGMGDDGDDSDDESGIACEEVVVIAAYCMAVELVCISHGIGYLASVARDGLFA